ncbi:MAG: winged helix-turn-helix domain-containing tetratricopeptide repeat protein [Alphaproteobacteria bacterium]|nr:winged helix-turn-helix domain-containing tetratricopeptide repeat protein [Alphaproteobacteria bacterium]
MNYRFGPYQIDTGRLELTCSDEVVPVQPQVFALMVFLLENRDRVVSKDEIIENVWQGRIVGDGTLNARINAIRRALGDDGQTQSMIRTMPRQGFRFVGELLDSGSTSQDNNEQDGRERKQASIAVLPFVNISGDQEQVYFADGLTEDLITDLSKIRDLFVIARNSSFSYRNSPKNVSEIGRELGVASVLEGSVRKAGNRIRINAQLVDAKTGGHVWAERYDSDVQDIFEVQDEITAKIIAALHISLTGATGGDRSTHSVEAYELSLKGRAKFFMFSPETNAECIHLLDQAIAIDPSFSNAWAEQVFPYQSGWSFAWNGYDDGLNIAEEKATRAVELGPNSSLAHSRLGWVQTFLQEPKLSIQSFERALELDANNADTHTWFCEALNYAGQPQRALEIGEKSLRFDPVAPPNCLHHIAHAYFLMGELEKAAEYDQRAIRMAPSFPPARIVMSAILVESGRIEEAREQIADLLSIDPGYNFLRYDERYPYYSAEHRERMSAALKTAGLA